jgi:hypothetical protein
MDPDAVRLALFVDEAAPVATHLSVAVEDHRAICAAHGRYVRICDGREDPFVSVDAEQEISLVRVRLVRQSSWLWRVRSRGLSGCWTTTRPRSPRTRRAELISIGREVVQPLVAAVGSLDRYGQLSAIEVFGHFWDPR